MVTFKTVYGDVELLEQFMEMLSS